MPPAFIDDLTARIRRSRFGRQVLGPKVAAPLANWLQTNFVEPSAGIEAVDEQLPGAAVTSAPTVDAVPADADATAAPATAEPSSRTPSAQAITATTRPAANRPEAAAAEYESTAPSVAAETAVAASSEPSGRIAAVRELSQRIKNDNLVVVAAGIAFWGLLAIPAVLFATISIAGLVLDPATVRDEVDANLTGLPEAGREIIADQLVGVSSAGTGGLIAGLVLGIVLALWTSSGAMAKLMSALNAIYGTDETRGFVKLRGQALLLTFGGIVFIAGAIFLLAVLPPLLTEIDAIGDSLATLFVWARFLVLGIAMVLGLGVLYHVGPDRTSPYRALTTGGVVATVSWVALSALFSIYTATVGSYNETYGSIGGIVVLLLWLFITAFVVLIGAEIHARSERDSIT